MSRTGGGALQWWEALGPSAPREVEGPLSARDAPHAVVSPDHDNLITIFKVDRTFLTLRMMDIH